MIVVRVELHSAVTGRVTELARMLISNDGSASGQTGSYDVRVLRGRSARQLDRATVGRAARVERYPRRALHVWNLVRRALDAVGYD